MIDGTPALDTASFLTNGFKVNDPLPQLDNIEAATQLIQNSPRPQEAWARTFKSIKTFPDSEDSLLSVFDRKLNHLTAGGKLKEEDYLGTSIGIDMVSQGIKELQEHEAVLPDKVDYANKVLKRLNKISEIVSKYAPI